MSIMGWEAAQMEAQIEQEIRNYERTREPHDLVSLIVVLAAMLVRVIREVERMRRQP